MKLKTFVVALSLQLAAFTLPLASTAYAQFKDYPQATAKTAAMINPALPSWALLDLETRQRAEGQTAMNYVSGNGNGYLLTRARGGITIAPVRWMNTYVQFQDAHAWALPLSLTAANMRDTFDFRQAYMKLHVQNAAVLAGRQELRFGGERLVGVSDWTNTGRTFDAVSGKFGGSNNVTLFTSSVVVVHPTSLDMHAGGLNFHGAYGSINTWVPHTTIEPYLFVKALPRVLSQQSIYGSETEVVPGLRAAGNLPFGFDYIAEGVLERGSFSNDSIHSGAAYSKVGYTAQLPWTPRVQGEYDYATGNPQTNAQRISTFDQLYPSAHNVFGLEDMFGWQNIKQVRFNIDLKPMRNLTLLIQQETLHAATVHDSIYNGTGSVVVKHPAAGFASDNIGSGFDISSKYVIHDSLTLNTGVAHFFPGPLMSANSHGAAATIAYAAFTLRTQAAKTQLNVK